MVTCAVVSCKNTSTKISKNANGISFHRFPRDKERRRRWEVAVSREVDWSSTSFSTVCSEHFNTSDFYLTESGLRRLSLDAVPSINISPCQEPEPTISKLEPIDIRERDSEVVKIKYKIRRLELLAENRKKKILILWREKRRLKKKVDKMTGIIKHLIKINSSETNIFNFDGVQV